VGIGEGEPAGDAAAHDGGRVEEAEVDPPDRRRRQEAAGRDDGRDVLPADAGDADDDGEDRLSEDDDREQAEPLGQMLRVDGRLRNEAPAEEGRTQLECEREAPEPVAGRLRDREGEEPDGDCRRERREVENGERPGRLDVADRARIEQEEHDADADVGDGEGGRAARESLGDVGRQGSDREHGEEGEQAVDEIVGVEAVPVEREPRPRPPHGDEEGEKAEESTQGEVVAQRRPQLGDRDHEDEVEEKLEPRRLAVLLVLERPQPRRLEEALEDGHYRPLNSGFRFAVKALRPSRASSEAKAR
jgi:hypothetical protein